jgi:hypothetical protein
MIDQLSLTMAWGLVLLAMSLASILIFVVYVNSRYMSKLFGGA